MKSTTYSNNQSHVKRESGQSMILIAFIFIALLGFVGLTVDVGRLFMFRGMLRNATDAASLSAAAQYREGRSHSEIEASAKEIMELNGISPTDVTVDTCDTIPGDIALCTIPPRKLVRVTGTFDMPMTFLQLVGVPTYTIAADSIGETASMDVVLVIDVSTSMTSDGTGNDRDPSQCNPADNCHPFKEVKEAARIFAERILDISANGGDPSKEQDRLAIVTFSNGWEAGATKVEPPGWMTDYNVANSLISNLDVYEPVHCDSAPALGTCRKYVAGNYVGLDCPAAYAPGGNPSTCTTTNIGGGLKLGGNMFALNTRPASLWVVVLLTDGAANASDEPVPDADPNVYGYCPNSTWAGAPYCRDILSSTYHAGGPDYDADDFARDMADFVGCYPTSPYAGCSSAGQGAVIFTIGLGSQVLDTYAPGDVAHGVSLLRYIANVGYDGNPASANDPCAAFYNDGDNDGDGTHNWEEWCGNYYFSPTGNQLNKVFEDIASRIFTRISH